MAEIRSQLVELTSKGLPYADTELGASLINGTSVKIKPYTAKDQKDLITKVTNSYDFYKESISNLIVSPVIENFDELLIGDIVPILVAVKIFTNGPLYERQQQCIGCQKSQNFRFNLSQYIVHDFDRDGEGYSYDNGALIKDEFGNVKGMTKGIKTKITDSISGEDFEITFKLPTVGLENVLQQRMHTLIKQGVVQDSLFDRAWVRLSLLIEKVNGTQFTINQTLKWLEDKSTDFPDDIMRAINEKDIGIVDPVDSNCPACKTSNPVPLVTDFAFFRSVR